MNEALKKILIYDGSCRSCTVMKAAASLTVSNYEFIDAGSDAGKKLVAEKNLDIRSSAYLVDGETMLSKSDMALAVIRDIRFIGPLLAKVASVIPRPRRERAYEWLVHHRIR